MKHGFGLIELLVSTVIASMIITGLLTALYIATRVQVRIDESTQEIMRASLVQRVMSRDISGIFVPRKVAQETEEDAKEKSEQAQKIAKEGEKKEEDLPVKKLFYATSKDGQLELLTFITDNPLQLFWGPVESRPVPRVGRVVYRLEQDKKKKQMYRLMRQEGSNLNYEAYQKGATGVPRMYELIDGIKELSLTYFAEIPEKGKQEAEKKEPKKKQEFKSFTDWKEQKKEDREKNPLPLAPQFAQIKLVLWDRAYKHEAATYEFTVQIKADMTPVQPQKARFQDLFTPPAARPPTTPQANQRSAMVRQQHRNGAHVLEIMVQKHLS